MIYKKSGKTETIMDANGITIKENGKVIKRIGPKGIFNFEDHSEDMFQTGSKYDLVKMNGRKISVVSDCGYNIVNNVINIDGNIIDLDDYPRQKGHIRIEYQNGNLEISGVQRITPRRKNNNGIKDEVVEEIQIEAWISENWAKFLESWKENWAKFVKWWREN